MYHSSHTKLVVLVFAEKWSPVAQAVAADFEALRTEGALPFAQIFILRCETEREKCWELK